MAVIDKCFKRIVMHIVHQRADIYTVNSIELSIVQTRSDLGVIVIQDLKSTAYCCAIAAKGFRSLWLIRGAYMHVNAESSLTLYAVFVRPELEFYTQVASPCLKMDFPGIVKLPYNARVAKLSLFSLSYGITRGDLITVF